MYRYVREATDLLAAAAPSLTAVLWRAGNGHRLGILDGTLVPIDRLGAEANRLYLLGQAPPSRRQPAGPGRPAPRDLVWISDGLLGSTP